MFSVFNIDCDIFAVDSEYTRSTRGVHTEYIRVNLYLVVLDIGHRGFLSVVMIVLIDIIDKY